MTTQCLNQLASELLPLDRMRMKLNTLSLLIQFVCPLVCLQQLLSPVTSWAASDVLSELIKKSHFWVTVVYSINPNVKGILIVDPPKKWRLTTENSQHYLNEIGQNSLSLLTGPCLDPTKVSGSQDLRNLVTLTSRRLNLNELEVSDFDSDVSAIFMRSVCGAPRSAAQDFVVRPQGNGSFAIDFLTSKKSILFVPADRLPTIPQISSVPARIRTQILRAPFGSVEEQFRLSYGLTPTPVSYLHHDLTNTMAVAIDPNFPKMFRPAINESLREWNRSLRKLYFSRPKIEDISIDQCISDRKICFWWDGPSQVTVRGMSCQAQYGFDPSTGLILGGMIACWSPKTIATTLDSHLTKKLGLATGELRPLLELSMIDSANLNNKLHPYPLVVLRHLLVHELGHFFGFGHNFKTSVVGSFADPAPSVMDYYPVGLVSPRTTRLGRYDRNLLEHIYSGTPISADYQYCSDADATPELYPMLKLPKMADCNQSDFGDPLEWIWNKIELSGGLSGSTQDLFGNTIQNAVHFEAFLTHPTYRQRARALICSARLSVEDARFRNQFTMMPSCQEPF